MLAGDRRLCAMPACPCPARLLPLRNNPGQNWKRYQIARGGWGTAPTSPTHDRWHVGRSRPLRAGMSGAFTAPQGVGNRAKQGERFSTGPVLSQYSCINGGGGDCRVFLVRSGCRRSAAVAGWAGGSQGPRVYRGPGWVWLLAPPSPAQHCTLHVHAAPSPRPFPQGHALELSIFVQCYSMKVVGRPSADNTPHSQSPPPRSRPS